MFKTLEDILQEYFGCKGNAFLKKPREIHDGTCEYFTKSGSKSYGKLVALLEDLGRLGAFEGTRATAGDIIENLDGIVGEDY